MQLQYVQIIFKDKMFKLINSFFLGGGHLFCFWEQILTHFEFDGEPGARLALC